MVTIRGRRPSPTLLWWFGTGVLAAILLAISFPVSAAAYDVPLLVALVAATLQAGSLPPASAHPRGSTVLQFAGIVAFSLAIPVGAGPTWPLTVPGLLTLMVFVVLIAARHPWRPTAVIWWASVLLLVLLVLIDPRGRTIEDAATTVIVYTNVSLPLVIAVLALRHWAGIRRQLAEARRDVAMEQSQRAMAEERTRIARELHDVVAHGMSVIHMQANSAAYRISDIDPGSKAEFVRIAAGARSTIREMRQLLTVLRDEDADPSLTPVPGLDRLAELVESTRQAGATVQLAAPPPPELQTLPDPVSTAAYRIVQESLSNVIRHAPGAPARVSLDLAPDELVIEVVNEAPERPPPPAGPAGHGLHGMRERLRLLDGTLATGTTDDGGYRVSARLPRDET
ncbi:histidine kinase [Pseudonocardia parietis]|uniref:histidine kinase n=1 Tax=Pseudonocardia parietis TaxID=570936 RepID=A0ABS4VPM3_9PSEU|nr:histidine kinase [Pseudonocardia parietis]MBP2365847.1 signal transduction histidine kinase [Pseudonocardia parietis]